MVCGNVFEILRYDMKKTTIKQNTTVAKPLLHFVIVCLLLGDYVCVLQQHVMAWLFLSAAINMHISNFGRIDKERCSDCSRTAVGLASVCKGA